jgi:general stress protein YciG
MKENREKASFLGRNGGSETGEYIGTNWEIGNLGREGGSETSE